MDNSRTGVEAAAYSLSLEEDEVAMATTVVEGHERVIFRGVTNKLRPYACASAARAASNSGTEFATEEALKDAPLRMRPSCSGAPER